MNDFFSVRFFNDNESINWFQITFFFQDEPDCYYDVIVSDDIESVYYASLIKSGFWHSYNFGKAFRYNVRLLKFDGDNITTICEDNFDINDHTINVILKSDDEKEIKIWKYYLWLLQIKMNFKMNIFINEYISNDTDTFVEISEKSYINYLKKSEKPLTDDYSSLTIISSLLDIANDKTEILNHPWFS